MSFEEGIKTENLDLIEAWRQQYYITHVTNCKAVMKSGVAKAIKESIPSAYDVYALSPMKLGNVSFADGVFNMNAQRNYGYDGKKRYLNYESLYRCLEKVRNSFDELGLERKIALPYRMGCCRAGGSWYVVYSMIKVVFEGFDVLICKQEENLK